MSFAITVKKASVIHTIEITKSKTFRVIHQDLYSHPYERRLIEEKTGEDATGSPIWKIISTFDRASYYENEKQCLAHFVWSLEKGINNVSS